jgi:glutamate--cysteine ligase catalytic subunit
VLNGCGKAIEKAKYYAEEAHRTQRSGFDPRILPKVSDIDDMEKEMRRATDGLSRLREMVMAHNTALEQAQDPKHKAANGYDGDEYNGYNGDSMRGNGGFAGADPKKRRGVSSPAIIYELLGIG